MDAIAFSFLLFSCLYFQPTAIAISVIVVAVTIITIIISKARRKIDFEGIKILIPIEVIGAVNRRIGDKTRACRNSRTITHLVEFRSWYLPIPALSRRTFATIVLSSWSNGCGTVIVVRLDDGGGTSPKFVRFRFIIRFPIPSLIGPGIGCGFFCVFLDRFVGDPNHGIIPALIRFVLVMTIIFVRFSDFHPKRCHHHLRDTQLLTIVTFLSDIVHGTGGTPACLATPISGTVVKSVAPFLIPGYG